MPTQLELEALHRQESSQHNAQIATLKDTRGLADLVNGKAIKSQIAEAVTELTVTKADLVGGKVPAGQLPSYVDDVIEVANFAALPVTGEAGKIYVTTNNGKIFRWTGSIYAHIGLDTDVQVFTGTLPTTSYSGGGTYTIKIYENGKINFKFDMDRITTTADIPSYTDLFTLPTECVTAINNLKTAVNHGVSPLFFDSYLVVFQPDTQTTFGVMSSSGQMGFVFITHTGGVNISNTISRFSLPSSYSVLRQLGTIELF
jgi:hypothetical protein